MSVTHSTLVDGVVLELPRDLARQGGVPLTRYSLARAIASEAGSGTRIEKIAVAHIVLNKARYEHANVTDLLTGKTGHYGIQLGIRTMSTRQDPSRDDLEVARAVLAGEEPDITGGARRHIDPATQDRLYAMGYPHYNHDAQGVIEKWTREGWIPYTVAGVDPSRMIVFVKGKVGLSPQGRLAVVAVGILIISLATLRNVLRT